MTLQISLTLAILLFAIILFVTERIRVDLVALLVLGLLAVTGLVTPQEAISGFSNPAVVTVWAVFVLSGGMSRTGVANVVGNWMVRLAGHGEVRLIVTIMLVGGVMSAFMNNVGVVALLLPVVVNIARQTGHPASRLLMPLTVGSLMGGMTTLIGTPSNILAGDALRDAGLAPFDIFDFAPVGISITLAGVLFMLLIGRRLLPSHGGVRSGGVLGSAIARHAYHMDERLSVVQIPEGSTLEGKTLEQSRLGTALDLTILRIDRGPKDSFIPQLNTHLRGGDRLTVAGRLDMLENLKKGHYLEIEGDFLSVSDLVDEYISMVELTISPRSQLLGKSLQQLDFRNVYGVIVLAMWRGGKNLRSGFDSIPLEVGDTFLVQGETERINMLRTSSEFLLSGGAHASEYELEDRLRMVRVPEGSPLSNKRLSESRLSEAAGLAVLGIVRNGVKRLLVSPQETLRPGDKLIVKGNAEQNLDVLEDLQALTIQHDSENRLADLESEDAAIVEAVLSPHSTLTGTTLRQLDFRRLYSVNVLSILRENRAYRSNLANMPLRFGDTFLLHGSRDQLNLLSKDNNFILLSDEITPSPRSRRAPLAVGIMLAVILTVMLGWLPIAVAAVIGASLMVLTGCLSMEEAYREIDWRAVFLIAGMLPLGIAMDTTGTANMLANGVASLVGSLGPVALIAGIYLLTMLASQFMPNPVVTVLMAPVALTTAANLDLSPFAIMITVAIGASSSFLSPVGHPANVLIMGPGGYRFKDYTRVGLPLTLVVLAVLLLVLPVFWPY